MVSHTHTTHRLLPMNCLSVLDHFVGLTLKGFGDIRNDNGKLICAPTKLCNLRLSKNKHEFFKKVKRRAIITYKHGICEGPHELPKDVGLSN